MPAIFINGHGDVSNSLQRTISGAYMPQKFGAQLSYVRVKDSAGGAVYILGYANPDASGQWSLSANLGGMTLNSAPGSGFLPGAEGSHAIVAQALDPVGNLLYSSAPVIYKLQRKGPILTFAAIPDSVTMPTLSVSGSIGSADAGLPISMVDDGRALTQIHATPAGQWSATIKLTGTGAHTLYATATDAAGNRGESPNLLTQFYTTPPQPTLASAVPTSQPGIFLLSGGIDALDAARPIAILDGHARVAAVPPLNVADDGAWTVSVVLAAGTHTLAAQATNAAGAGTSAPVTVQSTPPH